MTTLMIGQKQQDTFKRYDDFIKSTANRFESFVSFRPIFHEFVYIFNNWLKMVLNSNLNFGFHFSIFWVILDVFALSCCVAR
jgi:hypothetical protein